MQLQFQKVLYGLLLTILAFTIKVYAQIDIVFPRENSVFQRNNNNIGQISVSGRVSQEIERIEGRLIPRFVGQGTATEWEIIDNNIEGLSFNGTIEGNGGWYKLELRSIKNGEVLNINVIEKVGIGEVFVISGQSNAQGDGNPNASGARDERVIAYEPNYYNLGTARIDNFPFNIPIDRFTQLRDGTNIGPTGFTPYYWGELGDLLVKKLNVPVLFFNTALTGTSSDNWVASIYGNNTYHTFTNVQFQPFFPYRILKTTLNNVIQVYGIRSILWHQGEFDRFFPENFIFTNLNVIIQETRSNTGERIPWVLSRTSRLGSSTFQNVISAQNRIIKSLDSIFEGPATDDIQPARPDGAHFQNNNFVKGLTQVAEAWNESLNTNFFNNSRPILPKKFVELKFSCLSQSKVKFNLEESFQSYSWSNGERNSQIESTGGDNFVVLTDPFGNYRYSNRIFTQNAYPRENPIISSIGSNIACVGKSVELITAPSKYNTIWSNGSLGSNINVSQAGNLYAQFKNAQGCFSGLSNSINVGFVNPPAKPNIEVLNSTGFECVGNPIDFRIQNQNNFKVQWSNGESNNQIRLTANTAVPLRVTLFSNPDCPSPISDTAKYTFLTLPRAPKIDKSGPFSVKAEAFEKVNSYEWFLDNKFLIKSDDNQIIGEKDGFFGVKAVKAITYAQGKTLECKSNLSSLVSLKFDPFTYGISVFPNPSFDGKINISSVKEYKNAKAYVYDQAGKLVKAFEISSFQLPFEINLTAIDPVGKYLVKIEFDNFYRTFPVVFE